jgi:predicted tellurium resistance membrane protein TerC
MLEQLLTADALISLVTLTFLEVVLGVDNIIFISIITNKLPAAEQPRARFVGLALAMIFRIILLFGISILISLSEPFVTFDTGWFEAAITGQSLILFVGGLFLLYKATSEIHHKLEGADSTPTSAGSTANKLSFSSVIIQIILVDMVFSIDSILTAVGLTDQLPVMILAVIISIGVMMVFSGPISKFVNTHPSIQMLALAFLIMIGFMLVAEGAHLSEVEFFGTTVGEVPKGYLYFAIAFSLLVEFLNMRLRKKQPPVQLRGYREDTPAEQVLKP